MVAQFLDSTCGLGSLYTILLLVVEIFMLSYCLIHPHFHMWPILLCAEVSAGMHSMGPMPVHSSRSGSLLSLQ